MGPSVNNKKILENLAKAGALDSLVERNMVLDNIEEILKFAANIAKNKLSSQINLFGSGNASTKLSLNLKDSAPATKRQRLTWEKELLGLYLTDHPLGDLASTLNGFITPITTITEEMVDKNVRIGGIIVGMKTILTRSSETMAFVKIEDSTAITELIVFPKTYNLTQSVWAEGNILIADGIINNKDGSIKILVNNVYLLDHEPAGALKILKALPKLEQNGNGKNWRNFNKKTDQAKKEFHSSKPAEHFELAALTIILPENSTKKTLEEIKNILASHSGEHIVKLRVKKDTGYKELNLKSKVALTPLLKTKLSEILGSENVLI